MKNHKPTPVLTAVLSALLLLFVGSIFWVNFHGALWYDMDMALNSLEARLMWEQKRLFPEGWIFGNQYQIVDTVNVAALFYGLVQQSTLALSLASSLGALLVLAAFVWCIRPYVSTQGLLTGLVCIAGGSIFGYSAASYTKGLQVVYTMGAYYAWYLIVILLTLGAWLRLTEGKKVRWPLWAGILLLNFGIGMNSMREALVLGAPLLATALLHLLMERKNRKQLLFAALILAAELAGFLFMHLLNIPSSTNTKDLYLSFKPLFVYYNWVDSTKDLLRISGIALFRDGLRYLPLSLLASAVAAGVVYTLFRIFRKKDRSPLAKAVVFCAVSVLAVYATGIFLLKTRAIYYFVYWLLAALSLTWLTGKWRWGRWVVAGMAAVSFLYHFIPDFTVYRHHEKALETVTADLIDRGYSTLYGDDCAVFAAASHDKIVATPVRMAFEAGEGAPLAVFPYNKYLPLYDEGHARHGVVCFSDYYAPYLNGLSEEERENLFSCMTLIHHLQWGKRSIWLYQPDESIWPFRQ